MIGVGTDKNTERHLSGAGKTFVHPESHIEALEEIGLDKDSEAIVTSNLLIRVETEVDRSLQGSLRQSGKSGEVLGEKYVQIYTAHLLTMPNNPSVSLQSDIHV